MNEPTISELVERVAHLERKHVRSKRLTALALVGLAALGVMAQTAPTRMPKTVQAERFILMDQTGKPRAGFAIASDGNVGLRLIDMSGVPRVTLEVQPDGEPWIMLADANGKRRVAFVVNKDGSPGFSLMDGNEQARLGMSATDKGAGMLFGDAAGKVRASLGVAPTGSASLSLTGSDGDPRAIMIVMPDDSSHFRTYGKDGKIIWKAP